MLSLVQADMSLVQAVMSPVLVPVLWMVAVMAILAYVMLRREP